jgi:hypothetical protein
MPTKIEQFFEYVYDSEELKDLCECLKNDGSSTIVSNLIESINYNDRKLFRFLNDMVNGEPHFDSGMIYQASTKEQKESYFMILELLYNLPLRSLPVLMGTHREYISFIKWRLKLGR